MSAIGRFVKDIFSTQKSTPSLEAAEPISQEPSCTYTVSQLVDYYKAAPVPPVFEPGQTPELYLQYTQAKADHDSNRPSLSEANKRAVIKELLITPIVEVLTTACGKRTTISFEHGLDVELTYSSIVYLSLPFPESRWSLLCNGKFVAEITEALHPYERNAFLQIISIP